MANYFNSTGASSFSYPSSSIQTVYVGSSIPDVEKIHSNFGLTVNILPGTLIADAFYLSIGDGM